MPVITIWVNVPENADPEELKRLLELELIRRELVKERKLPKGDFRKAQGDFRKGRV
ncbi:hypothetical protein [Thermococcus cleftensis]|uniref:hypothetical protein n=1 Tax=Thermococcus cleftensis (strain DSM 27260 / KACC 17922 / CL1) TaxID=163003 RepID=UPI000AE20E50|nr:hypothetical protein [Thermococcus cleftensis]